jgi:gas vesicle protein
MKDNTKILGALVLGAAAGAVLGLLFAPDKGSNLRKKIKEDAEGLIDELAEKINEGKAALEDMKEKAMSKADDLRSKVDDEMEDYKSKGKNTMSTNSNHNNL